MKRTLLRPPEGVHSFTFHHGCGRAHDYAGGAGIDCPECVEHVRTMSPDERISHPHLRGPIVAMGETPGEIDALTRAAEARRHAASWRLVEAEEPATDTGSRSGGGDPAADDPAAELARLRQENEELRGRLSRKRAPTA